MIVELAGEVRRGRAIDARDATVDPSGLFEAIRTGEPPVRSSLPPGPVHEHVGLVELGMHLPLRTALAAAARSRGVLTEFDDAIARLESDIAAIDPGSVDLGPARERAAAAGQDLAALRERVATLRGHVDADRTAGRPTDAATADLREAVTALSEAETDAIAAEQALAAAERGARAARDDRDRRLGLADRRDNLVRRARTVLAERTYPRFRRALDALPVEASAGEEPADFEGAVTAAALAVTRIAALRAPVVVVDGPFSRPVEARAALDAPVVLV